ncbi:DUF5687 family protein [Roseivirga thermotolerans]|uniref:ABC transporter permease n=1 Tax=Roseivirga thermotolerans TaxID=1758176 RepID=A0ABQ3I554_9BACT|nr:DUF5687 family protein [Roseivirga thermotolerans]GHE55211.1 hypothetical protein GCM10011340_07410 [Roseivirga thermotolerans]
MIQTLLSHSFKQQLRSPIWAKNLIANVFLGFAALMLLFYVLLVGIFLPKILESVFPGQSPIEVVSGFVIYYFAFEFFLRFFLQNVPVLAIQPYLHLPMRKKKMLHFMLRKSHLSVFNFLGILIFLPFTLSTVVPEAGILPGLGWLLAIISLVFTLHFLTILFKKKLNEQPNLLLVIAGLFMAVGAADYYEVFSLSELSATLFNGLLGQPVYALIPLLLWFVAYNANYRFLAANTYPEEISTKKKTSKIAGDFAFLKRFGRVGELIALELKLILRHKRPKSAVFLASFLLLYGLIFYPEEQYQQMSWIFLFVGIFITGIFFIQYGQFLLSWESSYFDFVLTRKVTFHQYFEAKYYLFVATSAIAFVLSLGYAYFGMKIVFINLVCFLFNIGVNVFLVMRIALFSPKKIDLSKRAAFNYEGVGAAQFLMALPIIFLPYLVFVPFIILDIEDYGLITLGVVGLTGFILRDKWLNYIAQSFVKNRHKIAAGFRAQ